MTFSSSFFFGIGFTICALASVGYVLTNETCYAVIHTIGALLWAYNEAKENE